MGEAAAWSIAWDRRVPSMCDHHEQLWAQGIEAING